MQKKSMLTIDDAMRVMDGAIAEAKKNHWAVAIALVDDGGHLLQFVRLDGAPPVSAYIAPEKARAAALGRRETKIYEDMINQGRTAFLSAPLQGMLEGGVPIIGEGQVKSSEDAQVARAGIAALGL